MYSLVTVLYLTIITGLGQEILPSCHKDDKCSESHFIDKLREIENNLKEQKEDIKILQEKDKEIEKDVDDLTEATLFLLQHPPGTDGKDESPMPLVHGEVPTVPEPSYTIPRTEFMGTQFYFVVPNVGSVYNQLMISSELPGWMSVDIPYLNKTENISYTIGTTYRNISSSVASHYTSGLGNKGIFAKSSSPISLYVLTLDKIFSEPCIFKVYHQDLLGYEYVTSTYEGQDIAIVSTSDNTTVNITLRMDSNLVFNKRLYRNGDTVTLTFDRLSTFMVYGESLSTIATRINADKRVAVFHGRNYDFKQQLPWSRWGFVYMIPYLGTSMLSVTPYAENTKLSIYYTNVHNPQILYINQSKPLAPYIDGIRLIESEKPVAIAIRNEAAKKSLLLPHLSHSSYNYSCSLPYFYKPYSPAYENYVYIISNSLSTNGIKINDNVVSLADVDYSETFVNYNFTQIRVNLNMSQHVHVVSEYAELTVFILGYLHNPRRSYMYLYLC